MTKQQPEALRPADVLDEYRLFADNYRHDSLVLAMVAEIERLRAELEAVRKQEPLAWADFWGAVVPHSNKVLYPDLFKDYLTPLVKAAHMIKENSND